MIDESSLILLYLYAVHLPSTPTQNDIAFNILLRKSFVENELENMFPTNKTFFNSFLDSIYCKEHTTSYLVFKNNQAVISLILSLLMALCSCKL